MSTQQQDNYWDTWKRDFHIVYWLATFHQRCLVIVSRSHWGLQALGWQCGVALVLMIGWAYFSRDDLMWGWIALWGGSYIQRHREARRIEGQVSSKSDGWPRDAMRFCGSEEIAKRVVEPVLIGLLGFITLKVYEDLGWPVSGLPAFLLGGVFTVSFVEWVHQTTWQKRLRDMADARLENERAQEDFRDKYGR